MAVCWRSKRQRARRSYRRSVTSCNHISCLTPRNPISTLVVSRAGPEQASEMIARLGGLLRNTLSFPETHVVTLREEFAVTEEYLSIERVRFGPRLTVSLDMSPKAYEAQVPRFLLQPIVRIPSGTELRVVKMAVRW